MKKQHIVLGMGFGDEGKGHVVDWLCANSEEPEVIRFCGGPQAAHQVILEDGRSHVFSHYGSGTFRGAPTRWTKDCLVNPIAMLNEYDDLCQKGITPILTIDENCPIITQYDIIWNRINSHNDSCGQGIFATIKREREGVSLKFKDLLSPTIVKIKLNLIKNYYLNNPDWSSSFTAKQKFRLIDDSIFLRACDEMFDRQAAYITYGPGLITKAKTKIYEGSQGLLLDQNSGFFPFVTPSNTGTKNIIQYMREHWSSSTSTKFWLTTRSYQTRHGHGPMSDIVENNIKENPYEKNVLNKYQGEFRKTLLDLNFLRYAHYSDKILYKNPNNCNLVINCMDLIENEYRLFDEEGIIETDNESSFIKKIADSMNITENIYTSWGPTSNDIRRE
jgi:adenylosuccinate synthase